MIYRLYRPIAAAPSLHMQLQHIARSPAARLGISYQIVPRWTCRPPLACVVECGVRRGPELPPGQVAQLIANRDLRVPAQLPLNLGESIFLDNMLAGGINGQPLPLSISRHLENCRPDPCGMLTDAVA